MPSLNKVFLMGNVTRDPEVRYTPNGSAVAEIGLAINDNYKNKSGDLVERTCFVEVVTWGRQAETCGEYLSKGSPIMVEGSLEFDQWESPQGDKRSKLRVRALRVQFLGTPRRGGGQPGAAPEARERPARTDERGPAPRDETAAGAAGDADDLPF